MTHLPQRTPEYLHRLPPAATVAMLAGMILLGHAPGAAPAQERPAAPAADVPIPVEVKDMTITAAGVALTLVSDETAQELHLMIGTLEGQAIVRALRHVKLPRPQTHDLMKTLVEAGGWRVARVIIRELRDSTFFADIVLERPGTFGLAGNVEEKIIDARPSDAMALALRFDAKIYVRQKVFESEKKSREQEMREKLDEAETLTI